MDLGIRGRCAIVTGASRGIGRATASLLACEGVDLVLVARSAAPLEAAAEDLAAQGSGRVEAVAGDVVDPSTTQRAVAAAEEFGGATILVNNAGGESGHRRMEDLSDSDWEDAFRLHVLSAVRLVTAALPSMRGAGWGRVVNVASYTAKVPEPFCGPYAAAKAALVNVTRNLSRSYAKDGIRANCVLPGLTDTEGIRQGFDEAAVASGRSAEEVLQVMLSRAPIDVGRPGTASEVAAAIAFLCSEQASWISGAALVVDGGTIRSAL